MSPLVDLTLTQARDGLRKRLFSCLDYADATIARAEEVRELGAFVHTDWEKLQVEAVDVDRRGVARGESPLCGIPIAIKDNIDTSALPTTAATGALAGRRPRRNAPVAQRLFDAGALLAGKANMHELAFGITGNNRVTGPARNPYDPAMIAGGSSSGSAVAVAARIVPAALGTDTGGSLRIPAALCGIVGFRPTVGRYPGGGMIRLSHTRDTAGAMARSVADVAVLDGILAGADPENDVPAGTLSGVRIGIPRKPFFEDLDAEVENLTDSFLAIMQQNGAILVDVDAAEIAALNLAVSFPVVLYECMRALPASLRDDSRTYTIEMILEGVGSPDVRAVLASQLGPDAISPEAYRQALEVERPRLQAAYRALFATHGLEALVFPTTPLPARPIGEDDSVLLNGTRVPTFATYIRNTDPASNAGIPGISIPIGLTAQDLPVGIEFDGPERSDRNLLRLAAAAEAYVGTFSPMHVKQN
jgi:Asp-tRNA(Asn)/Glu-tRNA(Gln) amidotransferase A subunit family amidase